MFTIYPLGQCVRLLLVIVLASTCLSPEATSIDTPPNIMAKIRCFVLDFPSHRQWAEGYQKVASLDHDIHINVIPCDRWKFRMQVSSAELVSFVSEQDDVIVLDSMLDATPLVALLRNPQRTNQVKKQPTVLVYMHENQLLTPFTGQDRDKRNNTHWHYAMCNYRSLLVADGLVFNSQQHFDAFSDALPRLINQQCPRDSVAWHLQKAEDLLNTKCSVLEYGLSLNDYMRSAVSPCHNQPTILWNARLEEDKDPGTFIDTLLQLKKAGVLFKLIVLGSDPSKDEQWYSKFRELFSDQLIFMGWCKDRDAYQRWLQQAAVVLSTSLHETFGVSVLESVACGALPLLPYRLSYPEIFPPVAFADNFYRSPSECVSRLCHLLNIARDPVQYPEAISRAQEAIMKYDWSVMGIRYDSFFDAIASGCDIQEAQVVSQVNVIESENNQTGIQEQRVQTIEITDPNDKRLALYRPKSLRNHSEYQRQLRFHQSEGAEAPCLHGGRRAMVRMLEAVSMGSLTQPISFLTTVELAQNIILPRYPNDRPPIPIYVAEKEMIDSVRGQKLNSGDGILAIVRFPTSSNLDQLLNNPPILVLDDVRNAENVGSILRTAFCLGITSVVASRVAWAALRDSRSARCSMGTMFFHHFYKADSLDATLATMRSAGIKIYGIEIGSDAKPVSPHGKDRRWAAVLGNEDTGLSDRTRKVCDCLMFVPQAHGDSLNVGHAAAITIFELSRLNTRPEHDGKAACT